MYGIPPGQATFNWYQVCTSVSSTGILPTDPYGNTQYPPFVDPSAGGYGPSGFYQGLWGDNNPGYYNTSAPIIYDPLAQSYTDGSLAGAHSDGMSALFFDRPRNVAGTAISFDTFLMIDLGNGNFVPLTGFGWSGVCGNPPSGFNPFDPDSMTLTPNIPYSTQDQSALSKFGNLPPPHIPGPPHHAIPIQLIYGPIYLNMDMSVQFLDNTELLDSFEVTNGFAVSDGYELSISYDLSNDFEITDVSIQSK